ncbi:MAG: excinuclease ABC subunit UvrC, partial [Oscillospiraceae bacterium]
MILTELFEKALSLPLQPGCYIMRDKKNEIIYIGKAKRLRIRVQSYFRAGAVHQPKVEKMVSQVDNFDVIVTDSEFEALVLECSLIKQNKPKYNILLKDDKGFSYIKVSNERYPRITVELQKKDDGATYIGPYMSTFGIRRLVDSAVLAFRLPTCSKKFPQQFKKERPCLNAFIGRCMALCTGEIGEQEYNSRVNDAVTLITKGSKSILNALNEEMLRASEALEFEKAARLRDNISAIKQAESGQKVIKSTADSEMDVFAFAGDEKNVCAVVLKFRESLLCDKDEQMLYDTTSIDEVRDEFISHYYISSRDIPRKILCDSEFESMGLVEQMLTEQENHRVAVSVPQKGENHALVAMAYNNAVDRLKREAGRKNKDENALGELANLLGLEKAPQYIEAYDISNYKEEAVAGMVVFQNGIPKRSDYKRFIIKTVDGIDDYASMTEALTRRVARYDDKTGRGFSTKPDIILLDGGKGHLSVIHQALKNTSFADVPLFGMVKDDKHRTRGVVALEGELTVSMHKTAFALVTKIQDETHRFTVGYQRQRHTKTSFRSSLLDIEGIG